jgi:hypothetical protein
MIFRCPYCHREPTIPDMLAELERQGKTPEQAIREAREYLNKAEAYLPLYKLKKVVGI